MDKKELNVEELIKELRLKHRAYVETCSPNAGQIFADAADALEQMREREWMPVASTRDFNTVKSDLIRHLCMSCQRTDGEIWWYEGTLEVLVEFLSILNQKAEEGE